MKLDIEALVLMFVTAFGSGWLGQFLLARYSKTKKQREVDLSKDYLSLTKMTYDELERRINLVVKLDREIRHLQDENYLLKEKSKERDKQLIQMEAKQVSLQSQIDADSRDRGEMRKKLDEFDVRYRILWKYLIVNLENQRLHNIPLVEPPVELRADPDIAKFFPDKSEKK